MKDSNALASTDNLERGWQLFMSEGSHPPTGGRTTARFQALEMTLEK